MPYTYYYPSPVIKRNDGSWLLIDDPDGIRTLVRQLNAIEEERDALQGVVESLMEINANRNTQLQEAVLIIKCFQGWTFASEAEVSAIEFFEKYPELNSVDEHSLDDNDESIARKLLAAIQTGPETKNVACKCESCGRIFVRSFRRGHPLVTYLTNACDCVRERRSRYMHILESQDEPI